jgi:hypothetical protein
MAREEIRESIRDSEETVRRTRGAAANARAVTPAVRAEAPRNGSYAAKKTNSHANGSANHAASAERPACRPALRVASIGQPSSSVREGSSREEALTAGALCAGLLPDAASDDASGPTVAMDAALPAVPGAARDAYAAAAEGTDGPLNEKGRRSPTGGERPRVPSEKQQGGKKKAHSKEDSRETERPDYPGGEAPLPETPAAFVEEIHRQVSLIEVWKGFLNSTDDKIRQRAAEKLTEMRYKGAAAMEDERAQIVIDIDSAVARRAAQNKLGGADE